MQDTVASVKVIISGTEYTLVNTSGNVWSATVTAPAASSYMQGGGYFPVRVTATYQTGATSTVDDTTAGALGQAARLVVKERVKPTLVFDSPTAGQYVTTTLSSFTVRALDNANGQSTGYSGINANTLRVRIQSAKNSIDRTISSGFVMTSITGGISATYDLVGNGIILPDGDDYVITANVTDNDGNAADAVTLGFVIDTTPPELSVTSPVENFASQIPQITVSGVTTDAISETVTVSIELDGVFVKTATVDAEGNFSTTVNVGTIGDHAITVTSTDQAGKSSSVTRHIYFSDALPEFISVRLVPNPVDAGQTYMIEVVVE